MLFYTAGHSWLLIKIDKVDSNKPLYLIFNNIVYFRGPMQWSGANFCLASSEDWMKIMVTHVYSGFPLSDFREIYSGLSELVIVNKSDYLIQIAATGVQLTDDFESIRRFVE